MSSLGEELASSPYFKTLFLFYNKHLLCAQSKRNQLIDAFLPLLDNCTDIGRILTPLGQLTVLLSIVK